MFWSRQTTKSSFRTVPSEEQIRAEVLRQISSLTLAGLLQAEFDGFLGQAPTAEADRNGTVRWINSNLGKIAVRFPNAPRHHRPEIVRRGKAVQAPLEKIALLPFEIDAARIRHIEEIYDYGDAPPESFSMAVKERLREEIRIWKGTSLAAKYNSLAMGKIVLPTAPELTMLGYCITIVAKEMKLIGLWKLFQEDSETWSDICCELKERGLESVNEIITAPSLGLEDAVREAFPNVNVFGQPVRETAPATQFNAVQSVLPPPSALPGAPVNPTARGALGFDHGRQVLLDFLNAEENLIEVTNTLLAHYEQKQRQSEAAQSVSLGGGEVAEAKPPWIYTYPMKDNAVPEEYLDVEDEESSDMPELVDELLVAMTPSPAVEQIVQQKQKFPMRSFTAAILAWSLVAVAGIYWNAERDAAKPTVAELFVKDQTEEAIETLADRDLISSLTDEGKSSEQLIESIGRASDRENAALTVILAGLSMHRDYQVRIEAIKALSRPQHYTSGESSIINALHDEEFLVRGYAAKILSKSRDADALAAINRQLKIEENDVVRKILTSALLMTMPS